VTEESVVMSEAGILDAPAIAPEDREDAADSDAGGPFVPLHAALEETERLHIRRALGRTNGSVTRTAELLGISRKDTLVTIMLPKWIGSTPYCRPIAITWGQGSP
jgi:DNA-binding NtrC family response regulator